MLSNDQKLWNLETTRRKIGSTLGRGSERCSNPINIQANDTKLSTQSSLSANNNHSPVFIRDF